MNADEVEALRAMVASCTNAVIAQSTTNERVAAALERQASTNERLAQIMDRVEDTIEDRLKERMSSLPPPAASSAAPPAFATLVLSIGLAALVGSITAAAWIVELQPRSAQECIDAAEHH